MNNILTRALSGAVYVALISLLVLYGPEGHLALALLFLVFSTMEWTSLEYDSNKSLPNLFAMFTGIGAIVLASHGVVENDIARYTLITLVTLIAIFCIARLTFSSEEQSIRKLFHTVFGIIYIAVPLTLLAGFSDIALYSGSDYLMIVFILIWSNDTFAYLAGSQFGKHKLFERISPNKTWEGFFGGMAGTFLLSFFVIPLFFDGFAPWHLAGLALLVTIFGTLGDLFESGIKRYYKVKDSGRSIPGHGGFLDRIDSLLFVLPPSYLYIRILETIHE